MCPRSRCGCRHLQSELLRLQRELSRLQREILALRFLEHHKLGLIKYLAPVERWP